MTDIAKMTGGRYFRARDAAALQRIYDEIKGVRKEVNEHVEAVRKELSDKMSAIPSELIATLKNTGAIGS